VEKEINIDISEKIGEIFTGEADYRGAYGGRGGQKTMAFADMSILEMIRLDDKPWRFLCGRELQKSLKDSVFSVIASRISALGVQDLFDVGKEYIRCKNGNEYLFYGLKSNIAEVKGLHGVRRTWLEEAQKISNSSLTYLIPTVMRDFDDCEIWAGWNPEEEDDPIHELMVVNADERTKVVKVNYYDNPWFPIGMERARQRDLKNKPNEYGWIWLGEFNINSEIAVYGKWIERARSAGRMRKDLYDPELPVFTAWDLGYSDDSAIWWFQVAGDEIRLIDYHENCREDMRHYAEQILGYHIPEENCVYGANGKVISFEFGAPLEGKEHRISYSYTDHYVPHDAANKLLQAGGRSVVNQLQEFGIKTKVVAATSQQNQIAAGRAAIDRAYFDEVRCKDGIRNLKKYKFAEKENGGYTTEPIHDMYSHGCDAFEVMAQVWKSAKKVEAPAAPRFLNEITVNEIFYGDISSTESGRI
jgi:phage terminase large subunit